MPIYEYKCDNCNHEFDRLLPLKDCDSQIECEKCGQLTNRQISKGIFGMDAIQEPWQYEYTHRVKPKYVRDSKGNREKFDPAVHRKGRKGSG